MKINFVTFNFMGQKNLGDVQALKPLNLDGVTVPSRVSACSDFKESQSKECFDNFILSCAEMASNVACKEAEKRGVNPDDLFQEIMVAITEYVHEHKSAASKIYNNMPNRIAKRVAEKYNPEQDIFIRDVNPIDKRDLSDVLIQQHASEIIGNVLSTLTPRERKIIEERLMNKEPKTLENVGATIKNQRGGIGVCKDRVRQIEHKAINKLRHPSRAEKLKYLEEAMSNGSEKPSSTR